MKYLIAVALLATISLAVGELKLNEEQMAKVKLYAEECIKEGKISEEDALKIHNKDYTNPSENVKCFASCFFEKAGSLKDGVLQDAVILEKLGALIGEEKTKKIMEKCNSLKGENKCDTAFKLYECYEKAKTEIAA